MKNSLKILLFALAATMMFASCDKDAPYGLAVEYIDKKISAEGGTATFKIYPGAIDKWVISLQGRTQDWVELSQTSGNGDAAITLTISPNEVLNDREILVVVEAGDRKIPLTIVQAGVGEHFNVTPETLNLSADEGVQFIERSLAVTSNISWYAEITFSENSHTEWVMFLPDYLTTYSGSGDDTINLFIENYYPRPDDTARIATINFYNASTNALLKAVVITQNP